MKCDLLYIFDYYPERYPSASHYYGEMIPLDGLVPVRSSGAQVNSSRSALASRRSTVSKPSVNQP